MMLQVLRDWMMLQRSQWMSKVELEELQARKLRKIVDYAFQKVPFYRRLYETANMSPLAMVDAWGIERLPRVTRGQFNSTPLLERTSVDADINSCAPNTTSGSTGIPVTLLEDPAWAAYQEALNLRFLWAYGVKPWTKVCRVTLAGRTSIPKRLTNRQGIWSIVRKKLVKQLFTTTTDIEGHVGFFLSWKPDVLLADPSYCRALMKVCETVERPLSFRIVIPNGEMLDDSTRKLIGDRFGAEVYDNYGSEETGSIAWECPTHSGYHVDADSLAVEFLQNGKSVVGEPGEVCVTAFDRLATPVIRYLVGDAATCIEDECPCGRKLPLLKSIQGRVVDFIQTEGGDLLSPHEVIMSLQEACGVEQFKVIQNNDRSIDVLVKTTKGNEENSLRDVRTRCTKLFGQLPVTVRRVDRIDNSTGTKFRFVESRLHG